jgi:hypothetical protein
VERLREQRSEGAAGHDDRTLGTEGSSGADGYGGGERLEDGDLRLHPAPPDQDGLHRLGNPVTPDPVRPVARHQAHDQPSGHGHQSRPDAQVIRGRGDKDRCKALIVREVRDGADQPDERDGDQRANNADHGRHRREDEKARIGAEVTEPVFVAG